MSDDMEPGDRRESYGPPAAATPPDLAFGDLIAGAHAQAAPGIEPETVGHWVQSILTGCGRRRRLLQAIPGPVLDNGHDAATRETIGQAVARDIVAEICPPPDGRSVSPCEAQPDTIEAVAAWVLRQWLGGRYHLTGWER